MVESVLVMLYQHVAPKLNVRRICDFCRVNCSLARLLLASVAYSVVRCPSVRPSGVCHVRVLCGNK